MSGFAEPGLVGMLTASEDGGYPERVVVSGPLGDVEYVEAGRAPGKCRNIDSEFGRRRSGRKGFTCSRCLDQRDFLPRFCPGCGAEVER